MENKTRTFPGWTYQHCPDRDYTLRGDGDTHTIVSVAFQTPADFESLVLSANYTPRAGESLLTEVQICQGGLWSKFFKLGFYSATEKHSFDEQDDESGCVYVDVLRAAQPAQAYRYRLTIHGQPDIPTVTVCTQPAHKELVPFAEKLPEGARTVPIKPISQMQLNVSEELRKRLCSPTALCMAMNALGVSVSPDEVMKGVYDSRAQIYGNWTFNTAYAYQCGLDACVTQFKRLSQLRNYVSTDSLVVATIGYGAGELTDAAIAQTAGHLVVICGWNNNLVQVADPAASQSDEVIRFYHAAEFARVWLLNKGGMAYLVRKK